jgi:probable F420-dependent oxidoreductase
VTSRIRLGTGICLVPQRNPVYTAKEVSAVDWLSGGRFDFGVGVGWLAEEFEACATPFERRGARCRDYLAAMRSLWCEPVSEYKGEFYAFPARRMNPKPVQRPHPPIHFGGESDAALRRVADLGQGWYGFNLLPEDVPPLLAKLERLLAERGRTRADVQVSVSPYLRAVDGDALRRYRDAGVDQVIALAVASPRELTAAGTRDALARRLDELAEQLVVPASRL